MRHWADSFSLPKAHASLLDHLVGEREHVRRHGKAKRPGSLEIDDQLDLGGGLLNWQITGLFTFENAGGVDPGQTVSVGQVAAIAHQAAGGDELADFVDRRDRVTDGKRGELFAAGGEKRMGANDEPACSQSDQVCEHRIEVALSAGVQDMELQAEGAGRRLQVSCIYL